MNSVPANDTFAGLPTVADTAEKDPELKIAASRPANFLQESNYGENEDKDSRSMNVLSIAIRSARNVGSLRAALSEAGIDTAGNLGTPQNVTMTAPVRASSRSETALERPAVPPMNPQATHIPYDELVKILTTAFIQAGVSPTNAALIAENCASCERDGSISHGVFRMPGYLGSIESGWLTGDSVPVVDPVSDSYIRVDAANGFAQVALDAAMPQIDAALEQTGVAIVAIRDAHHFSSLWPDIEPFANRGFVALTMVTGGDPIVVPPGTDTRIFGTNPMAFATPRADGPPVIWDFATSTMSHGDLTIAHNEGRTLPEGRGVAQGGVATQVPQEILEGGGLLPIGGHKGALLMLMVESLASALTGAPFSTEADLGKPDGAQTSRIGQLLLIVDPTRGNPSNYAGRITAFVETLKQAGMERIPGERGFAARAVSERDGIEVTEIMRDFFATLD